MQLADILSKIFDDACCHLTRCFEQSINSGIFNMALQDYRDMNFSKAIEGFVIASKSNVIAHYYLGCMRYHGIGTPKNIESAVEHFVYASTCIPQAIYSLGTICKNGAVGFPADKIQALACFYILAAEDMEFALLEQKNLELEMNENDIVTAQAEAKKWCDKFPNWNMWILNCTA